MPTLEQRLLRTLGSFKSAELYVFGSRAAEVAAMVRGGAAPTRAAGSDVDIGVRSLPGCRLSVRDKVRLAIALEDLLGASRVDLVDLADADPFLATEVVRGERLFAQDGRAADEYVLYVLRRAGDLAPLERERITLTYGAAHDS